MRTPGSKVKKKELARAQHSADGFQPADRSEIDGLRSTMAQQQAAAAAAAALAAEQHAASQRQIKDLRDTINACVIQSERDAAGHAEKLHASRVGFDVKLTGLMRDTAARAKMAAATARANKAALNAAQTRRTLTQVERIAKLRAKNAAEVAVAVKACRVKYDTDMHAQRESAKAAAKAFAEQLAIALKLAQATSGLSTRKIRSKLSQHEKQKRTLGNSPGASQRVRSLAATITAGVRKPQRAARCKKGRDEFSRPSSRARFYERQSKDMESHLRRALGGGCLDVAPSVVLPSEDNGSKCKLETVRNMFAEFFKDHPELWAKVVEDSKVEQVVEERMIAAIRAHWEAVALDVYVLCKLTHRAYQRMINVLSSVWDTNSYTFASLMLPHGTKMCKLLSKKMVLLERTKLSEALDLQVRPKRCH
jgi:hypothetical protein